MQGGIDEMIDDAMWTERHGVWFSGPYRIWWSPERGGYVLWYYDRTSICLKRNIASVRHAKHLADLDRETRRAKTQEG